MQSAECSSSSNGDNTSGSEQVSPTGTVPNGLVVDFNAAQARALAGMMQQQQQQHVVEQQGDLTLRKIFIGGLPYTATEQTLREYFGQFGEIQDATVITERHTGRSRGYGFVTMTTVQAAALACADGKPAIGGRRTNVHLACLRAKPRMNAALVQGHQLASQMNSVRPPQFLGNQGLGQLYNSFLLGSPLMPGAGLLGGQGNPAIAALLAAQLQSPQGDNGALAALQALAQLQCSTAGGAPRPQHQAAPGPFGLPAQLQQQLMIQSQLMAMQNNQGFPPGLTNDGKFAVNDANRPQMSPRCMSSVPSSLSCSPPVMSTCVTVASGAPTTSCDSGSMLPPMSSHMAQPQSQFGTGDPMKDYFSLLSQMTHGGV